jgi:hypothetical protein
VQKRLLQSWLRASQARAQRVDTREQLPQAWAATQNNLGVALWDQANRPEGLKGVELLAQAVSAFGSALEVYTREQLPQY